jgi:hypothetical protein
LHLFPAIPAKALIPPNNQLKSLLIVAASYYTILSSIHQHLEKARNFRQKNAQKPKTTTKKQQNQPQF